MLPLQSRPLPPISAGSQLNLFRVARLLCTRIASYSPAASNENVSIVVYAFLSCRTYFLLPRRLLYRCFVFALHRFSNVIFRVFSAVVCFVLDCKCLIWSEVFIHPSIPHQFFLLKRFRRFFFVKAAPFSALPAPTRQISSGGRIRIQSLVPLDIHCGLIIVALFAYRQGLNNSAIRHDIATITVAITRRIKFPQFLAYHSICWIIDLM